MNIKDRSWELLILDASPPAKDLSSLVVGDVDGDGKVEIVTAGDGALLWYRPNTFERGIISEGHHGDVGLTLEDLDGDGIMEVVEAELDNERKTWMITWFKPGRDLHKPWTRYIIDSSCTGDPHDLLFVDLDGDGEKELIVNATYTEVWGVFLYKRNQQLTAPWRKYTIQTGFAEEGLAVADLDADRRLEIVSGPDWYSCPPKGPFSGSWERKVFAPNFREMVRVALADITGNGRPDIIIVESEYPDGRMSWFENRLVEDPENPWIEHKMDRGLNFAHSLGAWCDSDSGKVRVFLAEMAKGGWDAPYNWDARLIEYSTLDQGKSWHREVLYQGAGTHQAIEYDVDGDGAYEVVGKEWGQALRIPKVQIWRRRRTPSPLTRFRHHLLDRDKPYPGIDILAVDVDNDGRLDVVCGAWWYKNPTWERYNIPGIYQVVNAFDIDGDGNKELIATKRSSTSSSDWYEGLSSKLCWLKPVDPVNGEWEEYPIGSGTGDWPHGTVIAPVLPGEKLALIISYHGATQGEPYFPEIFEIPENPKNHPWPKRVLAEILYGEEIVSCDIDGDGKIDLVAGSYWLENLGNGNFCPHLIVDGFKTARVRVTDLNGDGRPDVILGEEVLDFQNRITPFSRLAWFENPSNPGSDPWKMHVIDKIRCPHSLDVGDLDGDGQVEVVCGEHDPFNPYRSRCRLFIYKKAEPQGRAWFRYLVDDRFEHHDGTKIFEVSPGRSGIISHGWKDSRYLHLWEAY